MDAVSPVGYSNSFKRLIMPSHSTIARRLGETSARQADAVRTELSDLAKDVDIFVSIIDKGDKDFCGFSYFVTGKLNPLARLYGKPEYSGIKGYARNFAVTPQKNIAQVLLNDVSVAKEDYIAYDSLQKL